MKFYIQNFILGTFSLQKIDKYRSKDPEKFKTINAIVEEEQPAGKKCLSEGCVGVLWLKRLCTVSLCAAFFYASWSLQELYLDCESVGDNDNVDCSAVQSESAALIK